jgi:hypothetical protein
VEVVRVELAIENLEEEKRRKRRRGEKIFFPSSVFFKESGELPTNCVIVHEYEILGSTSA